MRSRRCSRRSRTLRLLTARYRKEVYAPARKAAFDKFKAAKVVGQKKADKPAKVSKAKKNAAPKLKADEVIAKGEAAVAKFKAVAAQNKAAK